jgi:hypothetical protein
VSSGSPATDEVPATATDAGIVAAREDATSGVLVEFSRVAHLFLED